MSLGGYVNLVIVLLFWLFLSKNYTRLSYILGIILVLVSAIILFHDKMGFVFEIVSNREELSSNFKITDTPRTEMIVYPWTYLFENNIITILFGNGPSSMKYLSTTKTLATGNNYHVTSNNIFTDIGFEEGIIGVMGAVIFFIFLYRLFILNTHTKDIYIGRCSLFGKLFVIHLLVSSLYRADFISSRFWTVILIIYTLKTMIKTNTVKT
jgi:O-antigen ligase